MSHPTQRLSNHPDGHDPSPDERRLPEAQPTAASPKVRKAYQRPSVQKRRSVHQATLVSSGGTSGTLTSGGP
jgi:hypothetical protein